MRRKAEIFACVWLAAALLSAACCASAPEAEASWTAVEAARTITPEEAEALTGVAADKLVVVWSADYSTETYPVVVKLRLSGLDGLPVYVFEDMDGEWALLTVGTAPDVDVPVERDGSLSAVTTTVGANYPAKDSTRKAPQTGDAPWLPAAAALTALSSAAALVCARKKSR
ncbi:MAG: hypothetical protein K6G17_09235 [Oscillospiraceae bacterium]|nr:hypothetical protein [Oscillospiraceae bacterium]